MIFGRGDAILKYPELVQGFDDDPIAVEIAETTRKIKGKYVAVHMQASEAKKMPPNPELLFNKLAERDVPFLIIGDRDVDDIPFNFKLHTHIVQNAGKFVGSLSVFNVVAQVSKIPSCVLVNRSIQEPFIFHKMTENTARVVAWNVGFSLDAIYHDVAKWASEL